MKSEFGLPIDPQSRPPQPPADEVPSYGCVVYVQQNEDGTVTARVANLAGIQVDAGSERTALPKVIQRFKRLIQDAIQSGQPIPWLDPPDPIRPGEQKRFLPMHL